MSRFRIGTPIFASALMLLISTAGAQINPNDGPLVAPLQPEPTIGLPDQAPAASPPANNPRSAPAAPSASPERRATPQASPAADAGAAWQLECIEQDNQPRICQAVLRQRVNDQVAMVMAIAKAPGSDETRLQMALPLGIDVQRGAEVKIGDFSEKLTPSRCTAQGCLVEAPASEALLKAIREGNEGTVQVYAPSGDAIDLPMTLKSASDVFAEALVE